MAYPSFSIHFLFVFFLFVLSGFAQENNPDSLSAAPTVRLEEWLKDETISNAQMEQVYRVLLKRYPKEKAYDKWADLANRYFHHPVEVVDVDLHKLETLQEVLAYESEIKDSFIRATLHLKTGGAWFNLQQFDSAIHSYTQALEYFGEEDSIYIADSYFFRGQAEDYRGSMLNAMEDYQQARDIYESLQDIDYVNYVKGGMAILFSRFGIYDESQKIRRELIEYAKENDKIFDQRIQMYNMAETFRKQNKGTDQLQILQEIEELIDSEPADDYLRAMLYFSLSRYYGNQNDPALQQSYFEKGEKVRKTVPQINEENGAYLMTKARLLLDQANPREARQVAEQLLQNSQEKENLEHQINAYQLLSESAEKLGDYSSALKANQNLMSYRDSIFEVNQATSFAYYQTRYETEKKESEILRKSVELEETKAASRLRTQILLGIILLVTLVATVIFFNSRLRNLRKQKRLEQEFSQQLLKMQEEERKRISKDLHDGLGQSLLLIKNKVALNQSENAGEMLDTAISELRSIARSLHPMQLEKLGLSKALEQMLDQIDQETEIFVSSEIEDITSALPKEKELQLYRITQEAINNVLKHSEADALRVLLKKETNQVILSIEDNGKGFDFSEKYQDFQSLGLKTLKERTAAIQGSMKVSSEKEKGAKLDFIIYV